MWNHSSSSHDIHHACVEHSPSLAAIPLVIKAILQGSLRNCLGQRCVKILAVFIRPVIIHRGPCSVCSVFILPCHQCLIPKQRKTLVVSGTFLLFSNQACCRQVGSVLLGNYENPVTGFKWWSCVFRQCTTSVYMAASFDSCLIHTDSQSALWCWLFGNNR